MGIKHGVLPLREENVVGLSQALETQMLRLVVLAPEKDEVSERLRMIHNEEHRFHTGHLVLLGQ
jgi:N-acetylglucosamine-6-phosphate deacetylase